MALFIKQRRHAASDDEIVLWIKHVKWFLWIITRTNRRTNQETNWFSHASASCFTLGCRVRASPASLRCGPWARHIYPSLVLVQPRKNRPYITERLLMGRKESNQTNKKTLGCQWNEPVHEIMVHLAHATSEGSDEPAHHHSLARGITAHIHIEGTCLKLGL